MSMYDSCSLTSEACTDSIMCFRDSPRPSVLSRMIDIINLIIYNTRRINTTNEFRKNVRCVMVSWFLPPVSRTRLRIRTANDQRGLTHGNLVIDPHVKAEPYIHSVHLILNEVVSYQNSQYPFLSSVCLK